MHVHPPKPPHGWREFLGEVGIIVLGVLIALTAEQIVEALHWRRLVEDESRVLSEELRLDHGTLLVRVMMQPCIDRRLADLKTVFERHDAGQPIGLVGPIGRPSIFTGSKAALAMATADQSLSHMPLHQKQDFYSAYGAYDTFVPIAGEERAGWRALQPLDHPATLDAADWRELRKAYDGIVDNNSSMKANLRSDQDGQWLTPFKPFLITKSEHDEIARDLRSLPYVQKLCRPVLR